MKNNNKKKNIDNWRSPIALFHFFVQNQLFKDCQSSFIPGDSCISQLLSLTQDIHKSFDCNTPEDIRGVFLDISKDFDKVSYEGLIFELKTIDYAIGELLKKTKPKGSSKWSQFFLEKKY